MVSAGGCPSVRCGKKIRQKRRGGATINPKTIVGPNRVFVKRDHNDACAVDACWAAWLVGKTATPLRPNVHGEGRAACGASLSNVGLDSHIKLWRPRRCLRENAQLPLESDGQHQTRTLG